MKRSALVLCLCLVVPALPLAAQAGGLGPAGAELRTYYDSLGVEGLWLAGQRVDWESGASLGPAKAKSTHCSAFAAAALERRGVYLLRPPAHGLKLLANAQAAWLSGAEAAGRGWRPLAGADKAWEAQAAANSGLFVLAVAANPDPEKPGHIALVYPDARPRSRVESVGPALIQAGLANGAGIDLSEGFKHHLRPRGLDAVSYFVFAAPGAAGIPSRP